MGNPNDAYPHTQMAFLGNMTAYINRLQQNTFEPST